MKGLRLLKTRTSSYDTPGVDGFISVTLTEPVVQIGDNADAFTLVLKTAQAMTVSVPHTEWQNGVSLETDALELTILGPMEWHGLREAFRQIIASEVVTPLGARFVSRSDV